MWHHLIVALFLSLFLVACNEPVESATTCADLLAKLSEATSTDSDTGAVELVWADTARRAEAVLQANPDDPDIEACERIIRAVRDGEADKFRGG